MKAYKNTDEYIAGFDAATQQRLEQLREAIRKAAPGATEAISYGIPTFKLEGNLVHFAGYKNHIGFYPGAAAIEDFTDKLSAYNLSKGTIQFPMNKPLPLVLITKIVKYRVKQNMEKTSLKKKK